MNKPRPRVLTTLKSRLTGGAPATAAAPVAAARSTTTSSGASAPAAASSAVGPIQVKAEAVAAGPSRPPGDGPSYYINVDVSDPSALPPVDVTNPAVLSFAPPVAAHSVFDEFGTATTCPSCRTKLSVQRKLNLMYSICCGRVLCESCRNAETARESHPCPTAGCPGVVTRGAWSQANIDTQRFTSELAIRRALAPVFCLRREHFPALSGYHDYQELQQDVVYDLLYGDEATRRAADRRIAEYKRAHWLQIQRVQLETQAKSQPAAAAAVALAAADAAAASAALPPSRPLVVVEVGADIAAGRREPKPLAEDPTAAPPLPDRLLAPAALAAARRERRAAAAWVDVRPQRDAADLQTLLIF